MLADGQVEPKDGIGRTVPLLETPALGFVQTAPTRRALFSSRLGEPAQLANGSLPASTISGHEMKKKHNGRGKAYYAKPSRVTLACQAGSRSTVTAQLTRPALRGCSQRIPRRLERSRRRSEHTPFSTPRENAPVAFLRAFDLDTTGLAPRRLAPSAL